MSLSRSAMIVTRAARPGPMMDVRQSQAGAVHRIHRQQRVQKQTHVAAVPHRPQAAHAPGMGWVVQLGGVLDRQHMPSRRTLPGAFTRRASSDVTLSLASQRPN